MEKDLESKKKGIVIVGPSASGKTDLAIKIAKKLGKDILSADSKQVYVGLDYSTGKFPSKKTKFSKKKECWVVNGVNYWGYDLISTNETFSAGDFVIFANKLLNKLDHVPIVCGGTGMYVKALTQEKWGVGSSKNEGLRKELELKPAEDLLTILKDNGLEIKSLNESERKNKQRLIRKIEIQSEKSLDKVKSNYPTEQDCLFIGIRKEKEEYRKKIEYWIREDFQKIKEEVRVLVKENPGSQLFSGFIFSEMKDHLNEKTDEERTKELIITRYLQFIKRQNTFFNNQFDYINWFFNTDEAYEYIISSI